MEQTLRKKTKEYSSSVTLLDKPRWVTDNTEAGKQFSKLLRNFSAISLVLKSIK